ncbi:trafficking protein particle complex subunit 6A isoform 1-T1 [Trichechus inunguis]
MEAGVGGHAGGEAYVAGPMRAGTAGLSLGARGTRMADAVLFEFLHTEMVAELWARGPDPSLGGQKTSLSVLEGMGFHVGQALGERLPRDTLAFREELDALKFLCKDMWAAVFQKQMDGLRTNHQGTYVLQDNDFPLLVRMASGLQYLEEAPKGGWLLSSLYRRGSGGPGSLGHLPCPGRPHPLLAYPSPEENASMVDPSGALEHGAQPQTPAAAH